MSLLIVNGTLVTWEDPCRVLEDHAVYLADGLIQAVGPSRELEQRFPQVERLDARGQLVMPGNICAHTHFYGAYARGMAIPGDPPANFPQILQRLWWCLDQALDADAVRASALVCLVDAIKHGTTTLIDHHASPNFIEGSLDVITDAVDQAGLRAALCYEVTDRNGMDQMHAGIAENVRFLEVSRDRPRLAGLFGLHASMTLNDEALRACADAAPPETGFHIHVAEHEVDEEDSLRRSGQRIAQRLDAYGIWNERTIAAHCVHIDESERALLQERGVWITHQPRSNMNNGVDAADIETMLGHGMKLGLGNDGFTNNMWAEWKTAYLLHKVAHRDPRKAGGMDIVRMAVYNNARLVESLFPGASAGRLEQGARADVILVDYHPFTPLTGGNVPWHILFGFESSMVTTTIVDGRILMRDRQLQTLDEREIAAQAMELAPMVWERYIRHAESVIKS